ncbi:fasciclin domain-containing protein [Nocardioides solisilvae]|uniref:fasciclin domain-containing protein n=1 Tax=Nocardioides solisilvae TaxID=1542435 RepID=UPI000D74F49A|nr:fasciclin domain-containing protein [Nocardioides solisilvae]
MKIRTSLATLATTALLAAGVATPAQAADPEPLGNQSLAAVLTSDGNQFDGNAADFDILTEAVLAVLAAKPDSPVSVLTDGDVPLTAFAPTDLSFRLLAKDLSGRFQWSEKQVFQTLVDAVGVDAIEQVLLYHVIPGATIDSKAALQSDGVALDTAQGGQVTVDVLAPRLGIVQLRDADRNDVDPFLKPGKLDINKGNKQIAHGIFLVLRPLDL